MFKKLTVEAKSRSKSPNSQPKQSLKKNKTQKDLQIKSQTKQQTKKNIFGKSNLILAFKKSQIQIKKQQSPKWNNNKIRKPIQKWCSNINNEKQLKKIERQIMIQKPKIIKGKNDQYIKLQQKLKDLQDKIEQIKTNFIKQQRKQSKNNKNTSIKNKSKPKNQKTQSQKNKKIVIFNQSSQQQKNQSFTIQQQVLNNYVTQVKPQHTNHHKINLNQHQNVKNKSINQPYYTGLLIQTSKKSQDDNSAKQHVIISLSTINFLKKIKKPDDAQLFPQKIIIKSNKKNQNKKTIIFDLDQTLIHCNEVQTQCDIKLPIKFPTGENIEASINIRPYAKQILQNLSKRFQILVFTASHSCYANVVLDYFDPHNKLITQRLYRDQCYQTQQGMYVKDLRVISNRSLKNMVLVDNAAYSYIFQLDNGIPIIPFYDSKADNELRVLQKFLIQKIQNCNDVRQVLKKHFKLSKYHQYTNGQKLIDDLYIKNKQ